MAAPSWIPPGVVGWPPNGLSGGIHTRLLGFVKTALMRQLVPPNALVCDLFCGRGLDTERWAETGIGRYIGVDLSASALEEAQEQWVQRNKPFPAEFCELDPCMVDLEAHLQDQGLPVDIVSCLAHLQDSFTSEEMVKRLLKNVEAVLKPGGFFFGTAPDSSTIWYKYQKAVQDAMKLGSLRMHGTLPVVRTEIYKITFDDDRFLPFGSKYHIRFTDDGLPSQPQLLVHFPSLIRLAKEVGLECVEIQNLMEFYDDYSDPFFDVLRGCCGSLMDLKGAPVLDAKGRLNGQAMDVISLYTTFIFRKGYSTTIPSSVVPAFKASNSAARYLTNFPRQHSEKSSHIVNEEVVKREREPVKSNEHAAVLLNSTTASTLQNEKPQHDSFRSNIDTHMGESGEDLSVSIPRVEAWHDREEEVSEVMHEASPAQTGNQNAGLLDTHAEGHSEDPIQEHSAKRHKDESRKSSFQINRPVEARHPATLERLLQHPDGEIQSRIRPSKEASSSDGRRISSPEREKIHPNFSTNVGHKTSRPSSASGLPASKEGAQLTSMEIDRLEKLSPADQGFNHSNRRNESLDGSNGIVQHQEPPVVDHSSPASPKLKNDRMDETSRGEQQQEQQYPPPADRSPKHYTRRGHEKSSRGENQQELSHGDYTPKHYLRRTHENREDGNRLEKQQDQQRADHHSKRHQQRTADNVDQSHRHNNKTSSPTNLIRHYERRTHDNPDETTRNTKHQEPSAMVNASKHYTRRTSDSSNERQSTEITTCEKGRSQSGASKWVDRPGLQQDSHDVEQSSQGDRISRVVVKKFASAAKKNPRTAYVEDDGRSPHLRNKV